MTNSKPITAKDDKIDFQLPSFANEGRYLRTIMDSIPSGVVVIDAETRRIVDANPAALKMIGAARDNVIGVICHQFICPAAQDQCPICDLGQSVDNSERVLLTVQGNVIPIIKNVVTITLEARRYLIESFVDISYQKQTEDELRMLSRAVEQSTNTVIITDTNGIIEYVNPRFTQTAGYTPEEVIGQHTRILKSGESPPEMYRELWETITSGKIWRGEFCNKKKNGDLYWESVAISPVTDETGRIRHFLSMKEEITERKLAEEALRRSEEQFRTILETTPVPTLISRVSDGLVLYANAPLGEMFGTTPEALMGNITPDFYYDRADRQIILEKMKQEGQLRNFELQVKKLDGTPFWTIFSMQMMVYDGESALMVGFSDITERKRTEVALAKRAVELETVAEVGAVASTILDAETLLQQVVDLTKERFNLYHAHIYLLDDITNKLNLSAGAGAVGRKMAKQGWSISLDKDQSLVARVARTKQGITINDVRQEPGFYPNPLLPDTRAELAVPLIAGDAVLGVLDVQADKVDYFTEQDAQIQSILASQVAVALQNARLFAEQKKTSLLLRERVKGLNLLNDIGQEIESAPPVSQLLQWITERIPPATQHPDLCLAAIEFGGQVYGNAKAIDLPAQIAYGLYVSGQLVGRLYTAYTEKRDFINEESAMLGAVATRVSSYIENRRLFEDTQTALAQTEALYKGSEQISRAKTLAEVLEILIKSSVLQQLDRANFMLFDHVWDDKPPKTITVEAVWERSGVSQSPVGTTYRLEQIPSIKNLINGEALIAPDLATDNKLDSSTKAILQNLGVQGFVVFQLKVGNQWFGALTGQSYSVLNITVEQVRQLNALVEQAAAVIQNQRLLQQTQAALEEANLLRRAVEQSLDGSAVVNIKGEIQFINTAWAKMHGYNNPQKLLGQTMDIFHTVKQLETEVAEFNRHVLAKGAHQGELEHKRKDGTTFPAWMTVAMFRDESGVPVGFVASAQDITERKKLEESLKENEALYESLLDAIPQRLYRTDLQGRIVFGNKAYQELMGMSLEELRGKTVYDLAPKELADKYIADEKRVIQTGEIFEDIEIHRERSTGKTTYVQVIKSPVRDRSGQIIGLQGIFWDVTQQKEAELERERLLKEVETAYRQYVRQEWKQFLEERHRGELHVQVKQALSDKSSTDNGAAQLEAPISLRGQAIGKLQLEALEPEHKWSEDESALVEAVSEQLALTVENLRLFEDTQQHATREKIIADMTRQVWASDDLDQVMQTAVEQLGINLAASKVVIRLGTEEQLQPSSLSADKRKDT